MKRDWFHASTTKQMISAAFCYITQHRVVILTDVSGQPVGRLFKDQESLAFMDFLTLEGGAHRLSRNGGKELRYAA